MDKLTWDRIFFDLRNENSKLELKSTLNNIFQELFAGQGLADRETLPRVTFGI